MNYNKCSLIRSADDREQVTPPRAVFRECVYNVHRIASGTIEITIERLASSLLLYEYRL